MKMQSWNWQKKTEPRDLVLGETDIPILGDDDVLIQNTYIGLNPVDWKLIVNGHPKWQPGHVPGVDGAGIVVQVGKNMEHIQLSARVCYHTSLINNGSFATHTVVNGNRIMAIPAILSDAAAAAFPCPGLTAWQAFQKLPAIQNKHVLINSAGGSVGYFLAQLLLENGARVFVTASEYHHNDFYNMGVLQVVDYKHTDWKTLIKKAAHGQPFDAVFDTVNGASAAGLMDMLGYYGHIVAIQDRVAENPIRPFTTSVSVHEIALGAFHQFATEKQINQLMQEGERLLQQIGNGKFKQRSLAVADFETLNTHLQEMKDQRSATKYVVKI